jgi:hypothetical protein
MSQPDAPTTLGIRESPVAEPFDHVHPEPATPAPSSPGTAGDAGPARIRDDRGHFLPRAETPKATGGSAGADGLAAPKEGAPHARPIRVKKSKPVKQVAQQAQVRGRREVLKQAQQTAEAITQMLVTAATISVGPEAEPTPVLRQRIEEPMARTLERLSPEASEMVAKYSDPVLLGMALLEWGVQIVAVLKAKQALQEAEDAAAAPKGAKPPEPTSMSADIPPAPPAGSNGHGELPPEEPGELPPATPDVINRQMGGA